MLSNVSRILVTLLLTRCRHISKAYSCCISLRIGHRGINDHNLVVDRKYADVLFRGLTEDYYFNKTNRMVLCGNPEHRIYQVATAYKVNIRTATLCKQPLIPLRASHNATHWLLHPAYRDKMKDACVEGFEAPKGCICPRSWIELFHSGFYPTN